MATESTSHSAAAMDKLVPSVVKGLGLEQRLQESQVFFHWPDIVGKDIARHAQPMSLKNRLLIVAVDHPGWLQELSRYHKPLLLQKVRERIGKTAVKDIVFRIG
jgi:predicted nucleic acid-binding Zn ribbon protein